MRSLIIGLWIFVWSCLLASSLSLLLIWRCLFFLLAKLLLFALGIGGCLRPLLLRLFVVLGLLWAVASLIVFGPVVIVLGFSSPLLWLILHIEMCLFLCLFKITIILSI